MFISSYILWSVKEHFDCLLLLLDPSLHLKKKEPYGKDKQELQTNMKCMTNILKRLVLDFKFV
jgi:hypothetical protein